MAEGRFASVYSVEEFILEHENKNTAQKTERDVRLLERFLKTKDEDRKIEDIPAAELNEFISEFIISVRTKDGNEYEPTSLRSLMASFERHLNTGKQSMALFSGAVIQGGNFSIHINTVNQSPTLTTDPSSPEAVRWKRLRPLELESDSDDN